LLLHIAQTKILLMKKIHVNVHEKKIEEIPTKILR